MLRSEALSICKIVHPYAVATIAGKYKTQEEESEVVASTCEEIITVLGCQPNTALKFICALTSIYASDGAGRCYATSSVLQDMYRWYMTIGCKLEE